MTQSADKHNAQEMQCARMQLQSCLLLLLLLLGRHSRNCWRLSSTCDCQGSGWMKLSLHHTQACQGACCVKGGEGREGRPVWLPASGLPAWAPPAQRLAHLQEQ
jgi:hypothetical protein